MYKILASKVVFPDRIKYKIEYSDELIEIFNGHLKKK